MLLSLTHISPMCFQLLAIDEYNIVLLTEIIVKPTTMLKKKCLNEAELFFSLWSSTVEAGG